MHLKEQNADMTTDPMQDRKRTGKKDKKKGLILQGMKHMWRDHFLCRLVSIRFCGSGLVGLTHQACRSRRGREVWLSADTPS
jgi:hypothetical protein